MIEETKIQMKNADGHTISGAYRAGNGIITVTLSSGRSQREQRDYRLMEEDHAKRILLNLDRNERGKS